MDFKTMRLRHLVNTEFNFYPKNKISSDLGEHSENINRYDSDEHQSVSDLEEGFDLRPNSESKADEKENLDDIIENVETVAKFKQESDDEEGRGTIFKTDKKSSKYSNSFCKTSEKKLKNNLEIYNEDYKDEEILFLAENLNLNDENIFLAADSCQSFNRILKDIESRLNFENLEGTLFFTNVIQHLMTKFLNSYFNLEVKESEELILIIKNMLQISKILHFNFTKFHFECEKKMKNIIESDIKNKYGRILNYLLSVDDNLLQLFLITKNLNLTSQFNFMLNLTNLILTVSKKEVLEVIKYEAEEEEKNYNSYFPQIKIKLKSIFHKINSIFYTNMNVFCIFRLTSEESKNLFISCFNFLKDKDFSNIFILFIEIVCDIIKSSSSIEYLDKFVENIITFFKDFTDYYNVKDEKFYLLDKKISRQFRNYFGIYKCYNGDTISIYTLLFLRFFSVIYDFPNDKNDDKSKNKNVFIKTFENFFFKIFESKQNTLLLSIYCLLDDLISIKYNIEFSINLVILTNMFLCFSNLMTQNDLELSKKKFFLNCFEMIIENLLKDFKLMKEYHLCFNQINDNEKYDKINKNTSLNKCKCFSCSFKFKNDLNFFVCNCCKWKTNLKLQIINPDNDKSVDVCGFCNMKNYFVSLTGDFNILNENDENIIEIRLIETNEEIIEESSKTKKKISSSGIPSEETNKVKNAGEDVNIDYIQSDYKFFGKFLIFQDSLYKNCFTFIRANILNFLISSNKNENCSFSSNLDSSFEIFLKILISDQKINLPEYKNFHKNLINFYDKYKGRIYNSLTDIIIDENTINFFYFYYFYVNFLFAGHWKIVDILIDDSMHWFVRYKTLKILEKILTFEENLLIFENFQPEMLLVLLTDSSFYIREYSLEILFILYKYNKIERKEFIDILYTNINETSFLIRKRIIKALVGVLNEDKEKGNRQNIKSINFIFMNKIMDNAESIKIKNIIYDFYYQIFNNTKKNEGFIFLLIDIFIEMLNESEDSFFNRGNIGYSNLFFENIKYLFTILIEEKGIKQREMGVIIDFIFSNYLENAISLNEKLFTNSNNNCNQFSLIQALNLIKIITPFNYDRVVIYLDTLLDFFKIGFEEQSNLVKNNEINENKYENKIKELICEIYGNVLDKYDCNIKNKFINILEIHLIKLILSKPCHVMICALDCYFKILSRGMISYDKIKELTAKNYIFLKNQVTRGFISNTKKSNNNGKNIQVLPLSDIPVAILSKSLTLLSYITYLTDSEQLNIIFDFMFIENKNNNSTIEKLICENIFGIYKKFILECPISSLKFRAFESLGFFWIRFPDKLSDSKEIIESILKNISNDEEKLILLRTFNNFFDKVSGKIKSTYDGYFTQEYNSDRNFYHKKEPKKDTDFGLIHLFFENFIKDISYFLINENNSLIRLQAINLIKTIVELGNLNVHNILPSIFSSLFDHLNEIRFISSFLLEKVIKISKEKFLNFIKECLKVSFNFQKRIYILPHLINTFVKIKNVTELDNYENFNIQNENVFELLSYKMSKTKEEFNKKILIKFIQTFQEIKTIGSDYEKLNFSEIISKFEFFEYVATLIGDFKFSNKSEILIIFQTLYKEYESDYLVFQTKLREFKNCSGSSRNEFKIISLCISVCLKMSLFKFLLSKYENFDNFEDLINKNFDQFVENINDTILNETNKKNKKFVNAPIFSKEFKNFKFYQFYISFSYYFKKIFKYCGKSGIIKNEKEKIIDLLRSTKCLYKMKILDIRSIVAKTKKKLNTLNPDKAYEFLSSKLFSENGKKLESKSKIVDTPPKLNSVGKSITPNDKHDIRQDKEIKNNKKIIHTNHNKKRFSLEIFEEKGDNKNSISVKKNSNYENKNKKRRKTQI